MIDVQAKVELVSPFPISDVPRVWVWIAPFRGRVSDDFSPKTMADFVVHFRDVIGRATKTWAVYRSGELGGVIWCDAVSPVVCNAGCWFKKSFWEPATSIPALEAARDEMLLEFPKISVKVISGNNAMLSVLSGLGATKEALLKGHTRRDGKPLDIVMMALFRKEDEQCQSKLSEHLPASAEALQVQP